MLSFESDYIQGAHSSILHRLCETNLEPLVSYGGDKYSLSAKSKIKALCKREDAQVFLLTGGTQTNQIVIDTMLHDTEGVVCANTGHINGHESGAIEYTGHKVITVEHKHGKVNANDVSRLLFDFYSDENHEHVVFPGMVYVSHPTEYGTLYSLNELESLSAVCKEYDIPLYLDGARLGYGLMSNGTDVTLEDIARLCDVFYIGGTKVGALCGEAVVFTHNNAPKRFFSSIKQHGALLAKGRVLGVQFDTLFTDDLYFKISRHAIEMADMMRKAFAQKGYKFFIETITNQIFVVLDNEKLEQLKDQVSFGFWEKLDDNHTVVRFASSWATTIDDVNALISVL
ncbi:MAG: aminotransferase class I/II-fold pyridoxal phosphate-dependent enzyme [Ruminococcaceae bacterium]|nr:aminotransferase class I/II-fold pyridoxal phosphate-dependent enzyme [Oscillospiraceae bacterium]